MQKSIKTNSHVILLKIKLYIYNKILDVHIKYFTCEKLLELDKYAFGVTCASNSSIGCNFCELNSHQCRKMQVTFAISLTATKHTLNLLKIES